MSHGMVCHLEDVLKSDLDITKSAAGGGASTRALLNILLTGIVGSEYFLVSTVMTWTSYGAKELLPGSG